MSVSDLIAIFGFIFFIYFMHELTKKEVREFYNVKRLSDYAIEVYLFINIKINILTGCGLPKSHN